MSQQDFEAAADTLKNKVMLGQTLSLRRITISLFYDQVQKTLTNEELKEVYALYKQATCGDISIDKPGLADIK